METPETRNAVEGESSRHADQGGVLARLFHEGYLFDFFQSVRILERFFSGAVPPGAGAEIAGERIRFKPYSGLSFPPADVHSVEWIEGSPPRACVTVTFHGLYGIDSPLPVYFFEPIARQGEGADVLSDFLDMFNHRLYSLFYRSWRKYRPHICFSAPNPDEYSDRSLCLAGLGTPGAVSGSPLPAMQLAAFAGMLSCQRRTAEGLRNLIGWFFPGLRVSLQENIRRWVPITMRPRLGRSGGSPFVLGSSAALGEAVMDASGKFRIELGPLTLEQFRGFLPGGSHARTLDYLMRLYAPDNLEYDIRLILRREEVPLLALGDRSLCLGLTTWIGRPTADVTSRVIEYSPAEDSPANSTKRREQTL